MKDLYKSYQVLLDLGLEPEVIDKVCAAMDQAEDLADQIREAKCAPDLDRRMVEIRPLIFPHLISFLENECRRQDNVPAPSTSPSRISTGPRQQQMRLLRRPDQRVHSVATQHPEKYVYSRDPDYTVVSCQKFLAFVLVHHQRAILDSGAQGSLVSMDLVWVVLRGLVEVTTDFGDVIMGPVFPIQSFTAEDGILCVGLSHAEAIQRFWEVEEHPTAARENPEHQNVNCFFRTTLVVSVQVDLSRGYLSYQPDLFWVTPGL
ncbi:unnamed protein product [Pieris brassicae]|uniref:Peptidase A2 domain-containing protein n=1 Tax=Pieris brassicae TaxID=7116 RepID=A0A9P0TH03_PIEBR|nr:unnamed protein product [Pieris brassicae]